MNEKSTVDNVIVTYKTTDYDIFKGIVGNRPIYEPHLVKLIKSIQEKDLLENNPIIVNQRMEIVDGQHRLLAAKALSKPVYYKIQKDGALKDVRLLQTHRAWSTDDFLNSHIAQGNKEYIALHDFAEQYKISVPIAMTILAGVYGKGVDILRQQFKDGEFTIKNFSEAENVASFLVEIRRFCVDTAWADRSCMRAILVIMEKSDPKILLKRLKEYSLAVTRRHSSKEYLKEFEEIMNYGQDEKLVSLL